MNSNISPPRLGQQHPTYPPALQLLRVTDATIPGPTGGASAGLGTGNTPPSVLYIASTQQLRTDTYAPRDREPCLVVDVNKVGLSPGYYLGRLADSFQTTLDVPGNRQFKNLPVYEVAMFAVGGTPGQPGLLPGVTEAQLAMLNASLTPSSIANLNNLTACQLQVLLKLPVVNIQLLTNLDPTAVQNIVDGLTYPQLFNVATQVTPAQTAVIANIYPQLYQDIVQLLTQMQTLTILTNLSAMQTNNLVNLTPAQIQVIANLTVPQLQTLTNLTAAQVATFVGQSTTAQIASMLTGLSTTQAQTLTNTYTSAQIQSILNSLTVPQLSTLLTNLSTANLLSLINYSPVTIKTLVTGMTIGNLISFLNTVPPSTDPVITLYGQTLPTTATQNNVVVTGNFIKVPTTGATTITGLVPFDVTATQTVMIVNTGTTPVTIPNLSGSSSSNNQFQTSTGSSLTIAPNGSVTFVYDPSTNKWLDIAISTSGSTGGSVGGADTQILYNASNVETGDANLIWDYTNKILSITGRLKTTDGTRASDFSNGVEAGLFSGLNSGSVALCSADPIVAINDATHTAGFCSTSGFYIANFTTGSGSLGVKICDDGSGIAGHFANSAGGLQTVDLCNGTDSVTASGKISGGSFSAGASPGVASHIMPTAKLTALGANGSLTITGGIITAVTDPT